MNKENKELLLKDLCARLPYGVKVHIEKKHIDEYPYTCTCINDCERLAVCGFSANLLTHIEKYGIKPYLRPMSSITFEEQREYLTIPLSPDNPYAMIDWLNSHHFDFRGLIEKGLALEAPDGMYKI